MALSFKSPKDQASFTKYWKRFIGDIKDRENLKPSHLYQLEVLCDLCVERDELKQIIEFMGLTYTASGRNGDQLKLRPEVQQLNRVVSEIRNYSKILGLILAKDSANSDDGEVNDFM